MVLRAVCAWLGRTGNHSSESEVDDDGAKRGAGCERERVVSFSTCDTCLFGEAELVGRRDARAGILAALRISSMGDGLMTARGIPPPSCLCTSASCSSVEAKPAGNVEGVGTSLRAAMMLDQQLNAAFQTGLRHSLDESDHDAMFDLSETKRDYPECVSLLLTTLLSGGYWWVSLCGLKNMGYVLRVHTSRWVFEYGIGSFACQRVFAILSQSTDFFYCSTCEEGYMSVFFVLMSE